MSVAFGVVELPGDIKIGAKPMVRGRVIRVEADSAAVFLLGSSPLPVELVGQGEGGMRPVSVTRMRKLREICAISSSRSMGLVRNAEMPRCIALTASGTPA